MRRRLFPVLFTAALMALVACNRNVKETSEESTGDHVSQGPRLAPQRVAHGLAKLDKSQKFTFDVPPHAITPRLQGSFTSFVQGPGGARINDESADVELMVMTDEQYDAYVNHRSAEALYAIEPSHDHGVSIALPATRDTGAHYYVLFRRTNEGKTPIWVNSDLSVQFEPVT